MGESSRSLENYYLKSKPYESNSRDGLRQVENEMSEPLFAECLDHMKWILRQNEGKNLLIPLSGGKDSVLTTLVALEEYKDSRESLCVLHDTGTSSAAEQDMVHLLEREYGVKVEYVHSVGSKSAAEFRPDTWKSVEEQFFARHAAIETQVKERGMVRVLSGNLTEDLAGLLTPAAFTDEDRVLQPVQPFFASEVTQMLRRINVPRDIANQLSYTSETGSLKEGKEGIFGASYEDIDAMLWLKWHSPDVRGIADALGMSSTWVREFLTKRVRNREEAIKPILVDAFRDQYSLAHVSEKMNKMLADYRWDTLRRRGAELSKVTLAATPGIETFYEGI